MTDHIVIRDLRVDAVVGVTDEERARPQPLLITVDISADLSRAAAADELSDTIDYDAAVTKVADLVRSTEAHLLEHLAGKIADLLIGLDGVDGVTVEIAKENVPVNERVGSVRVRIER